MQLDKVDNLYAGDKYLEFILVPECQMLEGFTVFNKLKWHINTLLNYNIQYEFCSSYGHLPSVLIIDFFGIKVYILHILYMLYKNYY